MPKEAKEINGKSQKRRRELTSMADLNDRLGLGLGGSSQTDPLPSRRRMITLEVPWEHPENNIVDFEALLKEAGVMSEAPARNFDTDSESDSAMSDGFQTPDPRSPSPLPLSIPPVPDFSEETDPFFRRILENAEKKVQEELATEKETKKRKKRITRGENYDVNDPFIDDSELAPSQRYTGEVRPSVDGFFVWKGPLTFEVEDNPSETKKATTKRKSTAIESRARKNIKKSPNTDDVRSNSVTKNAMSVNKISAQSIEVPPKVTVEVVIPEINVAKEYHTPPSPNKSTKPQKDSQTSMRTPSTPPNRNGTIAFIVNPVPPMKDDTNLSGAQHTFTPPPYTKTVPDSNETPGKSLKQYQVQPLPREVQHVLDDFKLEVARETFAHKNRFPPNLRNPLQDVLRKAFECLQFNENLFKTLTNLLPYNKYTVTRLCKRTLYPTTIPEVEKQREILIKRLKAELDSIMPALIAQQLSQNRSEIFNSHTDGDVEVMGSESNMEIDGAPNIPVSCEKVIKFKWTEKTKGLLWQIIQSEMDVTVMKNDLAEAEDKSERLSEQTMRKQLYQRLLELWPPGWMTSYDISRMYSAYKRIQNVADKKSTTNTATDKQKSIGDATLR